MRAEEHRRAIAQEERDSEERNRILALEIYERLGLRPGVDQIDVDTGRILYGESPTHPDDAAGGAGPSQGQ
jgi:hypothetical protein